MRPNEFIKSIIFYVITFTIVATLFKLDRDNKINSYLDEETKNTYLEYKTVYEIYHKVSILLFNLFIEKNINESGKIINIQNELNTIFTKNIDLFEKIHLEKLNVYKDLKDEKNFDELSFFYQIKQKEDIFNFEIKFNTLSIISEIAFLNKMKAELVSNNELINDFKEKPFSTYSKTNYIIQTFIPFINPINNKIESYIKFSKENKFIEEKYTNSYFLTLMTMILITALFIYIHQLNKAQKLLDRKFRLEVVKSRKKDLQLLTQARMISVGETLNNIAHQWRQPLSIITTSASGLKLENDLGRLSNQDLDIYLNHIINQSTYLTNTIESFKDFIDEEKNTIQKTCIQEKINDSLKLVQSSLINQNILIYKNYSEKKIFLNTNPGEFTQAILNILNNARDSIKEANKKDKFIIISISRKQNLCTITIEDSGIGINKKHLNKIFEPYFTTKHKSVGTGIGLYICYETIVHKLKGNIKAKNTENGAKFIIKIPIDEAIN